MDKECAYIVQDMRFICFSLFVNGWLFSSRPDPSTNPLRSHFAAAKTAFRPFSLGNQTIAVSSIVFALLVFFPVSLQAKAKTRNPEGKVYVSEVRGDAQVHIGDRVELLTSKSVYDVEGLVIETLAGGNVTLVFSNGTSLNLDSATKIEVKRFEQEPFTPNRTDMEVEPSISQMHVRLLSGNISVSSSKLVAGSSMIFETATTLMNTQGGRFVMQSTDTATTLSVLAGNCTVRAGLADLAGAVMQAGQQAVVQSVPAAGAVMQVGQQAVVQTVPAAIQNHVDIAVIPPAEATKFDDQVAVARMAQKVVYFEVKEIAIASSGTPGAASGQIAAAAESTASGGSTTTSTNTATVTAFDGPVANSSGSTTTRQEIFVIQVVPSNLPVEFTVSAARLHTPTGPGG